MQYYIYGNGVGSSYVVDLQRHVRNVQRVELLTVSVARNTEYNITQGSNCLSINGLNYTIPNGRYTGPLLANVMTTVISPMAVTFHEESNLFIINDGNQPFTLTLNTPEIKKRLGFKNGTYTSVDHATTIYSGFATGQILFSDTGCDLRTNDDLLLDIQEFRTDAVVYNQSDRTFGVIGKCFNSFTSHYNVVFEQAIPRISRLTVNWLKSDGSPVDFHGAGENSFLLRLTCRKSNDEGEEPETFDEALLLKKVQRIIDDSIPVPKESNGIPRFVYVLIIIALLGFIVYRVTA